MKAHHDSSKAATSSKRRKKKTPSISFRKLPQFPQMSRHLLFEHSNIVAILDDGTNSIFL